jgi:mannose-6-phosphate isomerase-like protein (cupin superfamily)
MEYSIVKLEEAPKVSANLNGRVLYSSERFELVHLTLSAGEGMDLHAMPFEVVFFIREGDGTLSFSQEEVPASSGDCIRVLPGVMRGWRNTGANPLKLVVMKLK